MSDIKILIATHTDFSFPSKPQFLPIQTGKKIARVKLNIQGDDEGDNISEKQPNYNEITALYWAWKNLKNIEYIGLNHHRRYFCETNKFQHSILIKEEEYKKKNDFISIPDYQLILKTYDIIKVKPFTYYHSIESVLTSILCKEDLMILETLIKEDYLDYYPYYIEFMRYNNKISSCNMFISRFELFDDYSTWLFDILFKLEKKVKISPYSQPSRIFGFLSEALFNIYCIKNNIRIKYLPIYVIRDDQAIENNLIFYLKNVRRNISFFFNKVKRK